MRLSFNYFISDTVAGFLVDAVDLLGRDGHRLLGDYAFDPRSGHWRHHRAPPEPALPLLAAAPAAPAVGASWLPPELKRLRDFSLPARPA